MSRYIRCPSKHCKCVTRHVFGSHVTPGFIGRIIGLACNNCGYVRIGHNMRISEPDQDSRWATREELIAMRKARKAEYAP